MNLEEIRQRAWDYGLTVITVLMLGGMGLQSFVGTVYVWLAQRADPMWEKTSSASYVEMMNLIAAPQLIALIVVMGLCVPKRLLSRRALIVVSTAMVLAGVVAGVIAESLATGVSVYLALAALIQVAVVALTAVGAKGPSYLTEGRLTKLGSGLLHLGFILFAIVVASLQRSPFMLPVFWTSTVLMTAGTVMSFYADRLSFKRLVRHEEPVERAETGF
jgi:hypothetical protein